MMDRILYLGDDLLIKYPFLKNSKRRFETVDEIKKLSNELIEKKSNWLGLNGEQWLQIAELLEVQQTTDKNDAGEYNFGFDDFDLDCTIDDYYCIIINRIIIYGLTS